MAEQDARGEQRDADRVAQLLDGHEMTLEGRRIVLSQLDHHRREHDEQREDQQEHRRADDEQHVLEIQPPHAPRFADVIGAIEPDAHTVNTAHGAPDGDQCRDRQQPAARHREDGADLRHERLHQPGGHDTQKEVDDALGKIVIAEETGESGQEDQERKDREHRAEGDVAGKRDRLVGEQPVEALARQRGDGRSCVLWLGRHGRSIAQQVRSDHRLHGFRLHRCPQSRIQLEARGEHGEIGLFSRVVGVDGEK